MLIRWKSLLIGHDEVNYIGSTFAAHGVPMFRQLKFFQTTLIASECEYIGADMMGFTVIGWSVSLFTVFRG